jgi:hypothetical protein
MKVGMAFRFTLSLGVIYLSSLISCKKHEPLTQEQVVDKELTSNPWRLDNVTVDGVDETTVYSGLVLTFTATTYLSANGLGVWPASDTWSFTDNTATSFKRGDGTLVTIEQIDNTQLILTFYWATDSFTSGRNISIKGHHTFKFIH